MIKKNNKQNKEIKQEKNKKWLKSIMVQSKKSKIYSLEI